MECGYRNAATNVLAEQISSEDLDHPFLQIGAMFDTPRAVRGKTSCFSYQDGNIAQALENDVTLKMFTEKKLSEVMRYEADLYRSLDAIFTTSEYLRKSFVTDFGVPESRVINVGAGVNLDSIPLYRHEKSYDTKSLLFIGVDFERKGGWNLLKAFRILRQKHRDAKLHIVGPPKLSLPGHLMHGVEYHGYLCKTDSVHTIKLSQLFSQCSLFVMPSLFEPFGVAPLEAMVNQLPCIVTRRWALKEMVQPGFNGALVEPGDVDELYGTISRLLDSPDDLRRMGHNGRELVLKTYTWEHAAQRVRAFVENRANLPEK
jgi:glycosyltransferase involved in cell wall biosynthesis